MENEKVVNDLEELRSSLADVSRWMKRYRKELDQDGVEGMRVESKGGR